MATACRRSPSPVSIDSDKNLGQGKFAEPEPLVPDQPKHVNGGRLADFNGDSRTDFLAGLKNGFLRLYLGDEQGRFSTAGREIVPRAKNCVRRPP